jgi:hypothetical protein
MGLNDDALAYEEFTNLLAEDWGKKASNQMNAAYSTNPSGKVLDTIRTSNVGTVEPIASVNLGNMGDTVDFPSTKGNVRYFGGSYSGADIKVVVHMYAEAKLTEDAKFLDAATLLADLGDAAIFDIIEGGSKDRLNVWYDADIAANVRNIVFTSGSADPDKIRKDAATVRDGLRAKIDNDKARFLNTTSTVTLGTLQTLSVQSFREKNPVRALGASYAKGYTRGPRTIGGSMIFTMFDEHALADVGRMLQAVRGKEGSRGYDSDAALLLADQLIPLDMTIVFANEYGNLSRMGLYGVEFIDEGYTMSIEDLLMENVCHFVARDFDPMQSAGKVDWSKGDGQVQYTGTSLLRSMKNNAYDDYLNRLGVRLGYRGR